MRRRSPDDDLRRLGVLEALEGGGASVSKAVTCQAVTYRRMSKAVVCWRTSRGRVGVEGGDVSADVEGSGASASKADIEGMRRRRRR